MPSQIKNKGGRPATGRYRTKKFGLELSNDEREWLSRKVYALRQEGENASQNGLIVKRVFLRGWKEELEFLRHSQRGLSRKDLFIPR